MKYSYIFVLFAFLFIIPSLSPALGQTVSKKHRIVTYQHQSHDTERTPRDVSDEEYQEAFDRLDAYLQKALNIAVEKIETYDFSDEEIAGLMKPFIGNLAI